MVVGEARPTVYHYAARQTVERQVTNETIKS